MADAFDRTTERRLSALVSACLTEDPRPAVRRIERDGLWESVAAHAWQTRVGGLLLHHLRRAGISPPDSAARQLGAYREHVAAANACRVAGVEPVLSRLHAAGVPFLLLKGAALCATLYPEQGLRPMVDVDILIRPADAPRAHDALIDAGCLSGLDLVRDDFFPRFHYEREYFTPHPPEVKIDLHARPFRPLRYARTVPGDAFWDAPDTIPFGAGRARIPNPGNMLIHLAVHAACHGLRELRWLYDIRAWVERFGPRIDWQRVADRCRRWRLELPFRRALEAVRETWAPVDSRITRAIETAADSARLLDRLALRQAPFGRSRPVADVLTNFLCAPGLRFRLGYLRAVALPGRSHMGQLYARRHAGWLLAAHALRVARGLARPLRPADTRPA